LLNSEPNTHEKEFTLSRNLKKTVKIFNPHKKNTYHIELLNVVEMFFIRIFCHLVFIQWTKSSHSLFIFSACKKTHNLLKLNMI